MHQSEEPGYHCHCRDVTVLISPPALSESHKISQIRYANKGDYAACPEVNWNDASGRKQVSPRLRQGHSVTFDIADLQNRRPPAARSGLIVRIAAGEIKDCRTSEAIFHFDLGGTAPNFARLVPRSIRNDANSCARTARRSDFELSETMAKRQ
jgi:hypothetical protein